jgi:hypothetical protein
LSMVDRLHVVNAIGAMLVGIGLHARGGGRRLEGLALQALGNALEWRRWVPGSRDQCGAR